MLRAIVWSRASSSGVSSRPVKTTTGTSDERLSARVASSTSKPDMSGRRRSSTTQSTASRRSASSASRAGARGLDLDVVMAEQFADAHLLGGVVFHHQQAFTPRRGIFLDAAEGGLDTFRGGRLGDEGECAAGQAMLLVLVQGDDLDRDVPRQRVLLELAQHAPAQHVGQEDVERYRRRLVLLGEFERVGAAGRHQNLEPVVVREIDQNAAVVRVVLHDQQNRIARLQFMPVVGNLLDRPFRQYNRRAARPAPAPGGVLLATRTATDGPTYLIGR